MQSIKNSIRLSKPRDAEIPPTAEFREFTIIFVATSKDLAILPYAIRFALNSLRSFNVKKVQVYVPDQDIELVKNSTNSALPFVEICSENFFFPFIQLTSYFESTYPERGAWCSQQFLKLQAVANCETNYALIVDADTLLLRERPWVNEEGETLLNPSLEYHHPYYSALRDIGLELRDPHLSFVPHHMVYHVETLRKLLIKHQIQNIDELKLTMKKLKTTDKRSPFCVDYEIYGQEEYSSRGSSVKLMRWANFWIKPKTFHTLQKWPMVIEWLSFFFNSISIHKRV